MLPLLAHFPMPVYVNSLILHWFVGIPKQGTFGCLKTNTHEIANTVYKGFTSTEKLVHFSAPLWIV
jgi:hypothetical protein